MKLRIGYWLLWPALLAGEEWVVFRSGPFEVATSGDRKQARQVLNHLEQFRHVFGQTLNAGEIKTLWPVRITTGKTTSDLVLADDAYRATIAKGVAIPPQWNRTLAEALLRESVNRLPEPIERGLVSFFTNLQIDEVKVMGGAPPATPDRDFARVHLLMTSEEYYGRSRSLFFNLSQGVAREAAFKNSLGKSEPEIEKEVEAWLARGQYTAVRLNAKPINAERDFSPRPWDPAKGGPTGAMAAFDKSDFEAALRIKPDWPAAKFRLAGLKKDPAEKMRLLKEAAEGARRESSYWKALAEAQLAAQLFAEAGKSWSAAERAAANVSERDQIRRARAEVEEQRVAYEIAEKQRKKDEAEAELNRLRNDALTEIRRAEAKANSKLASESGFDKDKAKPVPWWEDPKKAPAKAPTAAGGTVTGILERVDCEGLKKTLVIREKSKALVRLLVPAGEVGYICGAQPKLRELTAKYVPLKPVRPGILGEAAGVEFAGDPE